VQNSGLPGEVFIDGMAVQVDDTTVYEPPNVRDYLVVSTKDRTVINYARRPDGTILSRILRDTSIDLSAGFTLENPLN
jgi:hypothetical protein